MAFHLVPNPLHADMEHAVQDLQEGIRDGQIIGLGIVVLLKGRRFFVDALGAMVRFPHESRGFVAELDDCLRDLGRRSRDTNTTL